MYRNYLLEKGFWPKKKTNSQIFLKHDPNIGGIYAEIQKDGFNKGIKIIIREKEYFFTNFDNLDTFFDQLQTCHTKFKHILNKKLTGNKWKKLEL
ncbi:MAG: hypothetical protein ACFFCV_11775 [Promethearchaeota archaeon]